MKLRLSDWLASLPPVFGAKANVSPFDGQPLVPADDGHRVVGGVKLSPHQATVVREHSAQVLAQDAVTREIVCYTPISGHFRVPAYPGGGYDPEHDPDL